MRGIRRRENRGKRGRITKRFNEVWIKMKERKREEKRERNYRSGSGVNVIDGNKEESMKEYRKKEVCKRERGELRVWKENERESRRENEVREEIKRGTEKEKQKY